MSDELLARLLEPKLGHVLRPWPSSVQRLVEREAAAEGTSPTSWLERLLVSKDPLRLARLVAAATVPHTGFFRHKEQFDHLRDVFLPDLARRRGGMARVWSAGCATGEEPYTLAMIAEQSRLDMQILATDVSEDAIRIARAGVYSGRAAAGLPGVDPRGTWTAPDTLKRKIRFEITSLVGPDPSHGMKGFDVVFCRNVLIYFDAASGLRIVESLMKRLRPGGALVVAPTEGVLRATWARPEGNAPLGWFVAAPPGASTPPAASSRPPVSPSAPSRSLSAAREPPPRPYALPPAPSSLALELASRCMGSGDYAGAETTLSDLLDREPDNAEAWFLLGEALLARSQRAQARTAFLRAARQAEGHQGTLDPETLARAAQRRADAC